MFRHILVTTDGSSLGNLAPPVAADLARRYGSGLTLLYVLPPPPLSPSVYPESAFYGYGRVYDQEEVSERLLENGLDLLDQVRKEIGFPEARVLCRESGGRPVEQVIADEVKRGGVDLVVMSTHGRSGLAHLILGSVAEAVLRQVQVPVLFVRTSLKVGQGRETERPVTRP